MIAASMCQPYYVTVLLSYELFFSISQQTAYIDVCDDSSYALRAKSLKDRAIAANIPAITTGGIYPGVSNGATINILVFQTALLAL